ncbi:SocA family protein [Desulfobulbus rhabdoformis]|uniref:Panacea domain-containing protein n=1 Tax=Desulfobulbus rhabdoformis TaxID=34032 RepID=UPI0019665299|nr:Panacea domain-containing protein [Desulfobulbus rhabdoformis]MBM9612790.1 SocA family protein [Desulfobulbus rhabdoformis]
MGHRILFHISHKKALEVLVWLASNKSMINIYHIAKVLFYADKIHMNAYGRPILGDTYYKYPYGPAPSTILHMVYQKTEFFSPRQIEAFNASIRVVKEQYVSISAKREPDLQYFSQSDLDALQESLDTYGDLSFDEIFHLTHKEKCYIATEDQQPIDYALMLDNDNPHRDSILENMTESSRYITM